MHTCKKCGDFIDEYGLCLCLSDEIKDNNAVDEFAKAMKHKLALARAKGRSGWDDKDTCSDERLVYLFFKHLKKANDGNFVDLANFLMFLHIRDTNPDILNLVKYLFKVDFEAELEEAMKPKTCDGCDNNHKDRTIFYDGKKALMCTFCKYGAVSYFKSKDNA